MQKKLIWTIGILLVLAVAGLGFFWRVSEKKAMAPTNEGESLANMNSQTTGLTGSSDTDGSDKVMVDETRAASIDDISGSIKSDLSTDESAMDSEESAEIGNVDAGGNAVSDMGQSYDESKY